jgi:Fe-S cluster biogenesis protein NfuA
MSALFAQFNMLPEVKSDATGVRPSSGAAICEDSGTSNYSETKSASTVGGRGEGSTAQAVREAPLYTECVSEASGDKGGGHSRDIAKRLQELIEQIQSQPNPAARVLLQDCVQTLLSFYGEGLSRVMASLQEAGATGQEILNGMLNDRAVSSLLLIHGLHPVALEERLRRALEKVRPYMQSHGGNIELLSLENEVAQVKLQGTCKTCPSSAVTLELAVRRAVEEACPDLVAFEVVSASVETTA